MKAVLTVSRDQDLRLLSRYLSGQGVAHRITELGDDQVLWLPSAEHEVLVREVYEKWRSGEIEFRETGAEPRRPGGFGVVLMAVRAAPVSVAAIAASVLLYPISSSAWLNWLLLVDVAESGRSFNSLADTLGSGEFWRLLSPMFIHFGWMHLVFNLVWVWVLGRRIEAVIGSVPMLWVVLTSSIAANLGQYFGFGASVFGGMSGVVYGLLGYCLMWRQLRPQRPLGLPAGLFVFMFVYLVLGFTGAVELLGVGAVANGAHLGGLIMGMGLGALHAARSEE